MTCEFSLSFNSTATGYTIKMLSRLDNFFSTISNKVSAWDSKHKRFLCVSAGFFLVAVAGKIVGRYLARRVQRGTVLELIISPTIEFVESEFESRIPWFYPNLVVFRSFLETIEIAANDPRIKGVVARLEGLPSLSVAQMQELGETLSHFKKNDKIYVPSSALGLSFRGLRVDEVFLRNTLNKLGIVPELDQRKEYKLVTNPFTQEKFTDAHKETVDEVLKVFFEQLVGGIAKNRSKSVEEVKELLAGGPYVGKSLLDKKLVDGVCYRDELYDKVLPEEFGYKTKKGMPLLYFHKYTPKVRHLRPYLSGKHRIALISCEGPIHLGKSHSPLQGQPSIGSDTVCAALRAAVKDKKVKAIILRINSGGGSYTASDIIAREIRKAKEAGKKVVVSMSGYAASGGYYISADADRIVAEPTTITGSIGVLFGKFVLRDMWGKVGVTFDSVETTENSKFMSTLHRFSPQEKERMNELLDYIYEDFKSKVSHGRHLSLDQVEEIAKGRIWLGCIAKEKQLVDELGGFTRAVEIAKELAAIPKKDKVQLVVLPRPLTIRQMLSPPRNSEEDPHYSLNISPFDFTGLTSTLNGIQMLLMFFRRASSSVFPGFNIFRDMTMYNTIHFRGNEAEIEPTLTLATLPVPK